MPSYRYSPFLSNHDGTRVMSLLGNDLPSAKLAATLLLTLPGLPFVYYGEEIGMTGEKPDPRLRTPMQWSPRTGVGFTRDHEWEAPQPDSMTRNVALEDRDPRSLLNRYRRLIHLRKENGALATGRLVPLTTTDTHVAAYLRRADKGSVLVVANLGDGGASKVSIAGPAGTLPAGKYKARSLLAGPNGAMLTVSQDGAIDGYIPAAKLGARQSLVLYLSRTTAP